MTTKPTRVIDAHVHLWDPDRKDWYPYLEHFPVHGSGDASRMRRRRADRRGRKPTCSGR